ncbi:iron-containing redox enzyme family protein [Variovorax sp. GT1P44]|uniref:iron-containing redox enzyme family protein n=1 Tax=Variovorax sp. GT1P44 TaxID=3443742 RepID=UPI003F473BFF
MNKADVLAQKLVHDFTIDNYELCKDAILAFCNSPLHIDDEHRYEQNYYGRRLRPHIAKFLDFSSPLRLGRQADYAALSANRILFAMNESDFLMLPEDAGGFDPTAFTTFYADDKKAAANLGMPLLEKFLFSFLEDEIVTSDNWTAASVRNYLEEYSIRTTKVSSLPSADAIDHAVDPRNAALDFLVQLAPDFLVESSPMARYASGSYGSMASELFKIIIDELGYGNAHKKHAAMFGDMLRSCDLNPTPHHYWQYYLNGSIYLANYYNMVTRNKRHFFRYVGAIYQAETAFITSCGVWMDTLQKHLPTMDGRYFREHCHIDRDHSRMVLDGIVMPAVEHYGAFAAREVVRGFEEARWRSTF